MRTSSDPLFSSFQQQQERQHYEVVIEGGKLMFKQTGVLVHTSDDSKWIFVLSTTKAFYVGQVNVLVLYTPIHVCTQFLVKDTMRCIRSDVFFGSGIDDVQKKKGSFQHSSFLAGGAITCAGRLVVKDGILKVCSCKNNIIFFLSSQNT